MNQAFYIQSHILLPLHFTSYRKITSLVFQFVCLIAGGMPLFESVLHSFATAGTGGLMNS